MQEMWVQSLGWEDALEKGMATPSSILVWEIPWQGSLVACSPWGCKRAGNDLATKQFQQQDSMQGIFSRVSCMLPGSPISQGPSRVRLVPWEMKLTLAVGLLTVLCQTCQDVGSQTQGVSLRSTPGLESGWRHLIGVTRRRKDVGRPHPLRSVTQSQTTWTWVIDLKLWRSHFPLNLFLHL